MPLVDRLRRGVPREQKMLKGHLPRIMCHQVLLDLSLSDPIVHEFFDGPTLPHRHSWDLSERGVARAEDAQGTSNQSHISPSILVSSIY